MKYRNRLIAAAFISLFLLLAAAAGAIADNAKEDMEAEELYRYCPIKGAVVEKNRPLIMFTYNEDNNNYRQTRLTLNGADVTSMALNTDKSISLTPFTPLPEGKNRVEITFYEKDEKKTFSWDFEVKTKKIIKSVTHNAKKHLIESDVLKVTAEGEPGCRVSCSIGHFIKDLPMREVSPGKYEMKRKIKSGDHSQEAPAVVRFICEDKGVFTKESSTPVKVDARFFRVRLISPQDREYVGQNFVIKGRTRPNTPVIITFALYLRIGGSLSPMGAGSSARTYSDDEGYFTYNASIPVVFGSLQSVISAWAVEGDNLRSIPDQALIYISTPVEEDKTEK